MKSESEVTQLCQTLSNPMDCSPPGSSVHGIFQARELEWGAIAFSATGNLEFYSQQNIFQKQKKNKDLFLDIQKLEEFITSILPEKLKEALQEQGNFIYSVRDMQTKTTVRSHLISRMSKTKKTNHTNCWWGGRATGTFLHPWWKCQCYDDFGKKFGSFLSI